MGSLDLTVNDSFDSDDNGGGGGGDDYCDGTGAGDGTCVGGACVPYSRQRRREAATAEILLTRLITGFYSELCSWVALYITPELSPS